MPKLTKTYIDKLTAPADKEAFHWDSEVKGFGLRVTPTGKVTYIVQGRVNGRPPCTVSSCRALLIAALPTVRRNASFEDVASSSRRRLCREMYSATE